VSQSEFCDPANFDLEALVTPHPREASQPFVEEADACSRTGVRADRPERKAANLQLGDLPHVEAAS
jgi:hypothetical protein